MVTSAKLISGDNHYIHTSDEVENWGVPVEWLDNTIEILNKIETYDLSVKDNLIQFSISLKVLIARKNISGT